MSQGTTSPAVLRGGPADRQLALWIRWVSPGDEGRGTRLGPGTTVLGRDEDCDAPLPSAEVSRRHAEIRWVGAIPMLRDLGSMNGVFLNQRRTTEAPLRPGDVLRLGEWIGILVLLPAEDPGAWSFQAVTDGYWASPRLMARLEPARRAAASDLPVIVQGETGVGKEGAARAVHLWSARQGPFLALNCAALPEAMAEGELFGYRKGAFTGADRANAGYLRAAEGGTLFLDEIGDLSLPVQAKLLRVIEEREVVPLGEARPIRVDVRLVAATQGPLRQAVEDKRFRGDLYARLNGFTLEIPPLRERPEEVPFLFRKLLQKHGGARPERRLDPLLIERLCVHDWPFNVRELTLLARRLVALHPDADLLDGAMWSEPAATRGGAAGATTGEAGDGDGPARGGRQPQTEEPDAEAFLAALRANRGNVKQTAAALGISRGRAYRFIEQLDSLNLQEIRRRIVDTPPPKN